MMTSQMVDPLMSTVVFLFTVTTVRSFTMVSRGEMHVVSAGSDVDLECEFIMERFNLFYNPILWQKVQYHEISELNIMANIKPPFDVTDKFAVTFVENSPRFMLGLSITNLSLEDSGNYTCDILGPGSALLGQVTHRIFVRAPVNDIGIFVEKFNITTEPTSTSVTNLIFMEYSPKPLQCVISGGNPPPDVSVTIGRRDVTNHFHRQTIPRLSGEKGFRLMETTTVLWSDSFSVGQHDDGKPFKCRASVPGLGYRLATARIQVNYAPVINCEAGAAYMGDKNVNVVCRVTASPGLTSLFWILDNNGTVVSEGDVVNEFWMINTDDDDDGMISRLFLRRANPDSFRTYTIVAENSVAVSTKRTYLNQLFHDPEPRPQTVGNPDNQNSHRQHNGYIFIQNTGYRPTGSWLMLILFIIVTTSSSFQSHSS